MVLRGSRAPDSVGTPPLRPPSFTAAPFTATSFYGRHRLRPPHLRSLSFTAPRFTAATFTATLVYGRPIYGGHVTCEPARIPPFYQCAIGHCIFLILVLQSPPLCFWVPRHPRFVPLLSFPYLGTRELNRAFVSLISACELMWRLVPLSLLFLSFISFVFLAIMLCLLH